MHDEKHEVIKFPPQIPLKVFTHKLGKVDKHWHPGIEILMVLNGSLNITIDNKESFILKDDDVIIINSNSIHELTSEGAIIIAIQIDLSRFENFNENFDDIWFKCNSANDNNKVRYNKLKNIIATMIKINAGLNLGKDFRNISMSYYLLSYLIDEFKTEKNKVKTNNSVYLERISRILNYVEQHYAANLTLNEIAEMENLSVPYFSSFFSKYMGVGFTEYYINLKLDHAIEDLIKTDHSIESIAVNHGFSEPHAFVRAFKKYYKTLPSLYRKENKHVAPEKSNKFVNYLSLQPKDYLKYLAKYLEKDVIVEQKREDTELININNLSYDEPIKELNHNFKKFTSVGRAREILDNDIQKYLIEWQETIGFEYIKFHGIISDDMMFCYRESGKLQFNFSLIDKVLDFLISIDLKPLIQLSFMPEVLAKHPEKRIFSSPFIISPPNDWKEWELLVKTFINHIKDRYGINRIRQWLYCVWNEPDTSDKMFGFEQDKAFYTMYEITHREIKKIEPLLQVGSPSLLLITDINREWGFKFLKWAVSKDVAPDFLNIHYYSDQFFTSQDSGFINFTNTKYSLSQDPAHFNKFIKNTRTLFTTCGLENRPVYLTEWNFSVSHRNLLNDTCFKSCYILKNLLDNYDKLDSFGYWHLTDMIYENPIPDKEFHGGMGVYSKSGIKKSVAYAFEFASRLGDELISSGEGYFITRKKDQIQVITYNYIHFNNLFADGEIFDMSYTNRYSAFDMNKKLDLSIKIDNVNFNRVDIKEYYINTIEGSAYDKWISSGALEPNRDEVEYLKKVAVPGYQRYQCKIEESTLNYNVQLQPLEIRLAIIESF